MPVDSEPQNHEIDAAGALDGALVVFAFALRVASGAVQDVNPARRQIDMVEQMVPHERAIAARIDRPKTAELVEVEGGRAAEVDAARLVQPDQLPIERNRCAAGGQSKNRVGLLGQAARDVESERATHGLGCHENTSAHHATKTDAHHG